MSFSLVMLNGTTPGKSLVLDSESPPVTIGRDANRELPIDDPLCSRRHARIWFKGHQWQIEDLGSRNGTYLNSEPIERATLHAGDVIRVGGRLLVFGWENGTGDSFDWQPSQLESVTFTARISESEQQQAVVEQLYSNADSGCIRNAAVLCRLATELPEQESVEELVQLIQDALKSGTEADAVHIWLMGAHGRLRQMGGTRESRPQTTPPHLLASLAVEQSEAFLVRQPEELPQSASTLDGRGDTNDCGSSICVPLSGKAMPRGAVECHRHRGREPFDRTNLELVIAIAHHMGLTLQNLRYREQLEQTNHQLLETVSEEIRLIGDSPAIQHTLQQIAGVAASQATVLIVGESGTGKELVARRIHETGSRQAGPFVAVNCGAFNESLLESELFGHEKGAFTGADQRRPGQFERAHTGTLFLDEVAEMSLACQVKLLRVLEGHPFERLGGSEPVDVDVRIIAATHSDLAELVPDGRFREDLYFRLRVVELSVPPLRERGEDVVLLARHFLDQFRRRTGRGPSEFSQEALTAIREHAWPGNVRELKNAIERAVVLSRGERIEADDLGLPQAVTGAPSSEPVSLAEMEQRHIRHVLDSVGGNKTKACKLLGIGRGTLYKKLKE